MNKEQLESYLVKRVLFEIKINKIKNSLNEEQINSVIHELAADKQVLNEDFFSTVASLLGFDRKGEVKKFLARRIVSFLGIPSDHPLSDPVVKFINKLPVKDITGLYRGDTKVRRKLVSTLADGIVKALKREIPSIIGLKRGSLGTPITDAMIKVVGTSAFKKKVKQSLTKVFVDSKKSDLSDLEKIVGSQRAKSIKDIIASLGASTAKPRDTKDTEGPEGTEDAEDTEGTEGTEGTENTEETGVAVEPQGTEGTGDTGQAGQTEEQGEEDSPETTEEKSALLKKFVKGYTGGKLGIIITDETGKQKRPRFLNSTRTEKYIGRVYSEFEKVSTELEKLQKLIEIGYITEVGAKYIEGLQNPNPEDVQANNAEQELGKEAGASQNPNESEAERDSHEDAAKDAAGDVNTDGDDSSDLSDDEVIEITDDDDNNDPEEDEADVEGEEAPSVSKVSEELDKIFSNPRRLLRIQEFIEKGRIFKSASVMLDLKVLAEYIQDLKEFSEFPSLIDTYLDKSASATDRNRAFEKLGQSAMEIYNKAYERYNEKEETLDESFEISSELLEKLLS